MSNGVASNNGRGVYDWPGRAMLPGSQLSNKELWRLAIDRRVHPTSRKAARIMYGRRVQARKLGFLNRIFGRRA